MPMSGEPETESIRKRAEYPHVRSCQRICRKAIDNIDIEVLWFDHVRSIPISSALFGSPGASLTEEISNDWDDWASGFGIS